MNKSIAIIFSTAVVLFAAGGVQAQNTIITSQTASGSLVTPGNWSPASVPVVTNDAVFSGYGGSGNIKLLTATNLTVGSLNVTTNNGSYAIRCNSTNPAPISVLTLGGPGNLGNSVPGANVNDLLYVATVGGTNSLRFYNTNAAPYGMTVVLGQSGNFDAAGSGASINVGAPIIDNGAGYGVTLTGGGTLTFTNTAAFSTLNVLNGTAVLNNSASLVMNLKSLLVTNNTLAATNSTFTFTSGTLTTSNAPTAIAANVALQTNTVFSINGTWNMIGGSNLFVNVNNDPRPGQLSVGNTTPGTLLISNATLNLSGPVAGNSNCAVIIATNSTVTVEHGGVLANVGSVLNGIGGASRIGANSSSFCSLIVTNGGYAGFTSDLYVGYSAGGVSNSVILALNSLIDFGPNGVAPAKLYVGNGNNVSNNVVVVNGGVLTNLASFELSDNLSSQNIGGFKSSLIVSNGGSVYVNPAGVSCNAGNNLTNANGNSLVISGSSSLVDMGGQILYVGPWTNAYNNSVVVNGGTLTNMAGFRLGYYKGNGAYNQSLIITNGGKFYNTSVVVVGANGTNNSALLAGAGSLLTNGTSLTVGAATNSQNVGLANTFGNSMVISNGATFNSGGTVTVGSVSQTGGQSISNYVIVGGGGATATLNLNLHSLYVGDAAGCNGNSLTLNTGGVIANGSGVFMVGDAGTTGSKFYFNGGKLSLYTTNANGIAGSMPQTAADGTNYISAGGAIIDDGGFTAIQKMPLTEDPNSTGGGLTKLGAGTLTLTNANTYSGATTVGNGTLLVNNLAGSGTGSGSVVVNGGATLGGNGTIGGAVTLASGAFATNVQGSPLTITGSLTLNNNTLYVSTSSTLTGGNYPLMNYNTNGSSGAFNATPVVGGAGVSGTATIVTGGGTVTLNVTSTSLPSTGTNLTFSVTGGNTLNLSWPTSYTGWQLRSNSINLVISNDWFIVAGSTNTNSVNITIDPTQPNVFYRMQHP